jgi:hypothetical protein
MADRPPGLFVFDGEGLEARAVAIWRKPSQLVAGAATRFVAITPLRVRQLQPAPPPRVATRATGN